MGCFNRARMFGHVADHPSPYIATTKIAWCCTSLPPYVSIWWVLGLIRHRLKFSFSFLLFPFIRFPFPCCLFFVAVKHFPSIPLVLFFCFSYVSVFFVFVLIFISLFCCWFTFLRLLLFIRWSVYFSGLTLFAFISSPSFPLSVSSMF